MPCGGPGAGASVRGTMPSASRSARSGGQPKVKVGFTLIAYVPLERYLKINTAKVFLFTMCNFDGLVMIRL